MPALTPLTAWIIVTIVYILPLVHIVFSKRAGPWRITGTSKCPFSPRAGWFVIILLTGIIGWIAFIRSLSKKQH